MYSRGWPNIIWSAVRFFLPCSLFKSWKKRLCDSLDVLLSHVYSIKFVEKVTLDYVSFSGENIKYQVPRYTTGTLMCLEAINLKSSYKSKLVLFDLEIIMDPLSYWRTLVSVYILHLYTRVRVQIRHLEGRYLTVHAKW